MKGNKRRQQFSEINVTPLVDVMLVLLIVFMITSPMMVAGVDVQLPESKAQLVSSNDLPLSISLSKGKIYIMETEIKQKDLIDKLRAITKENKETVIYLRADKGIEYGEVISILGEINSAGFKKVSLISNASSK